MLTANNSTLLQEGVAAAKRGDKIVARSLLLKATQMHPRSEIAWFWLSHIAASPHDAAIYLRRVLEINPQQERARTDLKKILTAEGIALAKAGEKAAAKSILQEVVTLDANSEMAWLWLAWVIDDTKEVVFYLERAIAINPHNEYALSWLERVRKHLANTRSTWHCPLCNASALVRVERCPGCDAILSFDDMQRLLNNECVDKQTINRYIEQNEEDSWQVQDFVLHCNLALSHFNIKQIPNGVKHLRLAMELGTEDVRLQSCLEQVLVQYGEEKETPRYRATILIVDDSPTVRKLVTVTLERQGYQVISAVDGMQALAKLNELVPDLILLDITMPHMDGYQVCKFIKSNNATKRIPVLMLSGKDGFFDKIRGRMAGSTEYLTKPFEPEVLLRAVEKHHKQKS